MLLSALNLPQGVVQPQRSRGNDRGGFRSGARAFPAQPVHPTEQYVLNSGGQGTEPPPPPPGVTSVPTLTPRARSGRARFEMLCIHLGTSLPAAAELAGLAGVTGDVLEAELLPAAVPKGRRARSCPRPVPAAVWPSGLDVSHQGPPSRAALAFLAVFCCLAPPN